jgi:molybdenum cofactor cytidylyltransferase
MKRGHPILLDRAWWDELLALPETATLRDFIRAHEDRIRYVVVETDSVLQDVDTPEEYDALFKG